MSNISKTEVTGVYSQWNIKVYDYAVEDGLKTLKCEDFQDLITNISTRRATAVEKEITAMAKNMELRNKQLDYFASLLADMGKVAAKINPDHKGDEAITIGDGWASGTLEALRILSRNNYSNNNSTLHVKIGTYSGDWKYSGSDTILKSTYEYLNQLGKSTVDALNNDAQADMTRLQSLVSKRDESFSTATSLQTAVSDTRSNLMKNF